MRSILVASLFACVSLVASEKVVDTSVLMKVPDLTPALTPEEVAKEFNPWIEKVKKITSGLKPEFMTTFEGARSALAPRLPQVTTITLYSIFPTDAAHLREYHPARADVLEKLPRFHDYPILGSVAINDPKEANRWTDFFREQILPGADFACDFSPRHGFRFSTDRGDIDILMCFSCDQMAFYGGNRLDQKLNPVFSKAVKSQLNQLFDKLKIERDDPSKKAAP